MAISLPKGFSFAGVHCGVKDDPNKLDLMLVVSDTPATAAGVYTQNVVCGAPVQYDRAITPSDAVRAVVVNSGISNACTGERGLRDAQTMATLAADVCDALPEAALVMSTGLIGAFLPMDKIAAGIVAAAESLDTEEYHFIAAAKAMMTTDTIHKVSSRVVPLAGGREARIAGMAKGAAMIGPNMATMLALVITDAALSPATAQAQLKAAIDDSFNCISVEGHTSTSDTVLLLANGQAVPKPLAGEDLKTFAAALGEVCIELARAIPADGEGADHLITIEVEGCADRDAAMAIAKEVANSALVKTAVAGADPNWGRIVSAAGYSGVQFDPTGVSLEVNGTPLYKNGAPVKFDAETVSASIRENRDTHIRLTFKEGAARLTFWTTDLTAQYVHLNADYHT